MPDWMPIWPPKWREIGEAVGDCVQRGDWGRYHGLSQQLVKTRLCELTGSKFCRLTSSGSIAIQMALQAAGVKNGDFVAVCGYDYPGNFRAIEILGAHPVLIDAAPGGFSLSASELKRLEEPELKAVVLSHLYGVPAEIAEIRQVCDERGWILIEDACQVPGMPIAGRVAGSWGDVGVYSFGGNKPVTAGNGGALLFQEPIWESRLKSLADRPSDAMPLGELQCSTVPPQLDQLERCNQLRHENALQIHQALASAPRGIEMILPPVDATIYKAALLTNERDRWIQVWRQRGVLAGQGYRSMHRSSRRRCTKQGELPRCRELEERLVLLDQRILLTPPDSLEAMLETLLGESPRMTD